MWRLSITCGFLIVFSLVANAQRCEITLQDFGQSQGNPPLEVAINETPKHCGFLQFAWRSFVAMNWPATVSFDRSNTAKVTRALPDTTKSIGQALPSDPTVWEMFQPNWYVFTPNNPPPPGIGGWNQDAALPSACGTIQHAAENAPGMTPAIRNSIRSLSSLSKFDPMPGVGQAFSAPLIDQTGYYARYEIRMNFPAFDFISGNQFYLASKQKAWADLGKAFDFPVQTSDKAGAIFIKAAWKTLSEDEKKSGRFHTALAFLFTPENGAGTTCAGPVTVGLVGLHIVQKTKNFPAWIWSTFEQIDNTPADPAHPGAGPWSFFKAGATAPNQKPVCPTTLTPDCKDWQPTGRHLNDKTGGPTQAFRSNPIPASPNQPALGDLNQAAQSALRQISPQTEWQFYQLVEAQWQTGPIPPPLPATPLPVFPPGKVANLTMETYTQGSSCMACHNGAKTVDKKTRSDLTFELTLGWEPTVLPVNLVLGLHGNQPANTKKK